MTQPKHPGQMVRIKTVEIDKKMVPLVKWLNKFHGVYTLFCCQGDEYEKRLAKMREHNEANR